MCVSIELPKLRERECDQYFLIRKPRGTSDAKAFARKRQQEKKEENNEAHTSAMGTRRRRRTER